MPAETIGILHPGAMGVSVAHSAQRSGHAVCYASEGRGAATRERAARQGLRDLVTLAALCRACTVLVSVCPPHAAEAVAAQVAQAGFRGLYVDANAIAPGTVARIAGRLAGAGIAFVDGGIIGGPAWEPGETWLYLAGSGAGRAAACFTAGPLEVAVIGERAGKASALKMCYAAYTKGTSALLANVLALAEASGVRAELSAQWERDEPGFPASVEGRARRVTAKAWRFAGEMDEIAATFEAAGLPGGFHRAAGELYRRLAGFKGDDALPELDAVLSALLEE